MVYLWCIDFSLLTDLSMLFWLIKLISKKNNSTRLFDLRNLFQKNYICPLKKQTKDWGSFSDFWFPLSPLAVPPDPQGKNPFPNHKELIVWWTLFKGARRGQKKAFLFRSSTEKLIERKIEKTFNWMFDARTTKGLKC